MEAAGPARRTALAGVPSTCLALAMKPQAFTLCQCVQTTHPGWMVQCFFFFFCPCMGSKTMLQICKAVDHLALCYVTLDTDRVSCARNFMPAIGIVHLLTIASP